MNSSVSKSSKENHQHISSGDNLYFARLMSPDEVAAATTRQPPKVRELTKGHWVLSGDVSAQMYKLLAEVPKENFGVRLTAFTTPSSGSYCVFTHQVQQHQSRLILSLRDTSTKSLIDSLSSEGRLVFMLGNDYGDDSLLLDCPLKPISYLPLAAMASTVPSASEWELFQELPHVMELMLNPLQVPSLLRSIPVQNVSVSMLLPAILNPDGQVKLLHLWPPKLLHLIWARPTDYEVVSAATAMRATASLSR